MNLFFDNKNLNLNVIQEDLIDYQANRDEKVKKKIIQALSRYFRHYPQLAFKVRNVDILSDFYLYLYERIDKILDSYQPDVSKFSTYLAVRLKTYWFNFCKQQKIKQKKSLESYLLDQDVLLYQEDKKNVLVFSDSEEEVENLNKIFSQYFALSPVVLKENQKASQGKKLAEVFNYLALKLFFFDFFNDEDFIVLKNYLNQPYSIILNKLEIFRQQLNKKKNDKMKWELRLNKIFHNLRFFESSFSPLKKNVSLRLKIQEQQEKILQTYYLLKLDPDIKNIANVLEEKDERKVWNVITYYKRKIQKNY